MNSLISDHDIRFAFTNLCVCDRVRSSFYKETNSRLRARRLPNIQKNIQIFIVKNINQLSAVFLVRVPLFLDRGLGSITSESIFCSIANGAPVDVWPSLSSSTSLE